MNLSTVRKEAGLNVITVGAFVFLPMVGLALQFGRMLRRNATFGNVRLLVLLAAVFLGAVNGTKTPESDLLGYQTIFHSARDAHFLDFVNQLGDGRDRAFFALTYAQQRIFFDNFWLYIVFSTGCIYWFSLTSIRLICEKVGISASAAALVILCAALLPDFFLWTGHTFRQLLAFSMAQYAFARLICIKKVSPLVLLTGVFVHSSVAFFVLPYVTAWLVQGFNLRARREQLVLLAVAVTTFVFASQMSVIGVEFLKESQVGERFSGAIADDSGISARALLYPNAVLFILAAAASWLMLMPRRVGQAQRLVGLFVLMYFGLMMGLYILGDYVELIAYRFLILVFPLSFWVVPCLLGCLNNPAASSSWQLRVLFPWILVAVFLTRFLVSLSNSVWTFGSTVELLANPALHWLLIQT